ncbi:MAG: malto-oligosyltrehalose synthase [Phycisphaeraceae bacterium]|nr:malto-oligosyltrehalose synthase [Phycisphaeraceae bacterium]
MKRPSPIATYRIQLTPRFGFDAAAAIVGYLADLGVSHLYLSPIFEATPGSSHGYDQTDPTRIRTELGGASAFERLSSTAHDRGLGIVLDIVPNHMAAHHANPWWYNLLKHGPDSEYDRFFDVDWASEGGRVVLPVLGAPLAEVIARGEITFEPNGSLCYFERHFPLSEGDIEAVRSGDNLGNVLSRQHYVLTYWRDGLRRLNYRRFFDISDLAGLRVEDPVVFDRTHAALFSLVARRLVDAVRVDHIDGLRDPLQYLKRLRDGLCSANPDSVPVFVEKILARGESLPSAWPLDGATGYEFLAAAASMMTDPTGIAVLRRHTVAIGAGAPDFHHLAVASKREVARSLFGPELSRLCRAADSCLRGVGLECDAASLRVAIADLSACLSRYRTYADSAGPCRSDVECIRDAARGAESLARSPNHLSAVRNLAGLLTLSAPFHSGQARLQAIETLRTWQQFTGPVAAKGVEDTALYRDIAILALNDVGTEPIPQDPRAQIEWLALQRRVHTLSMNATDTHDAKRSEDVRARLAVLTWFPADWTRILDQAIPLLAELSPHRTSDRLPAAGDLSLILHSAFALGPPAGAFDAALGDRLKDYITKATREAKRATTWISPSSDYEAACSHAVDLLLYSDALAGVRGEMAKLARATRLMAARMSLAIVMLKSLFPGTPDWYQGTECLALSFVDPDNRRPVDFEARRTLLADIQAQWRSSPAAAAASLLDDPDSDAAKLFVTWRVLTVRRRLLAEGARMTLESFERSPSHCQWRVTADQHRCSASVALRPDDHQQTVTPAGADQLRGTVSGLSALWASIVVEGVWETW